MVVFNNVVKVILTILAWLYIYGWQVVENNNFITNFPIKPSKSS